LCLFRIWMPGCSPGILWSVDRAGRPVYIR
jgi:hypothetical protein